jgi:hypothetical protein
MLQDSASQSGAFRGTVHREYECIARPLSIVIYLLMVPQWSFTLGLALSSLLDVLITGFLCYLLMSGRKKDSRLLYKSFFATA